MAGSGIRGTGSPNLEQHKKPQYTYPFSQGPNLDLDYNILFKPEWVVVNNPGSFFVWLDNIKWWVPPASYYQVIKWNHDQNPRVRSDIMPMGYTFPGTPSAEPAVFYFTDDPKLSASSGANLATVNSVTTITGSVPLEIEGVPGGVPLPVAPAIGTTKSFQQSLISGASFQIVPPGTVKNGVQGGFITVDTVADTAVGAITDNSTTYVYGLASFKTNPFMILAPAALGAGDGGLRIVNSGTATAFFRGSVTYL